MNPDLSRDGMKVAYVVPHGDGLGVASIGLRSELWVKSLVDGREAPLIADDYSRWLGRWSPDGTGLVFMRRKLTTNDNQLMVWYSQNHEEEPLTTEGSNIGSVEDWSSDGKWLLTTHEGIWLVPLDAAPHAETAARKIIYDPSYQIFQPHFSPEGRWILFEAVSNAPQPKSTLYVVPASGGTWTRISDTRYWADKPRWSPDGKTIYFLSGRGFFEIWGIHFDPVAGKTVGPAFQVSNFESPRRMIPRWIPPVGLSLTQDKLVLTLAEESGNIWVLDDVDR